MTQIEHLKLLLPVIQAFVEGKKLQWKSRDYPWMDYDDSTEDRSPAFWNDELEWRVKPEPREWWDVVYKSTPNSVVFRCVSLEEAGIRLRTSLSLGEIIHVREVL